MVDNNQNISEETSSGSIPPLTTSTPNTPIGQGRGHGHGLLDFARNLLGLDLGHISEDSMSTNFIGSPEDREAIQVLNGTILALKQIVLKKQQNSQVNEELTKENANLKGRVQNLEKSIEDYKLNATQMDLDYSNKEAQAILDCLEAQESEQSARATLQTVQLALTRAIKERDIARNELKNIALISGKIAESVESGLKTFEPTTIVRANPLAITEAMAFNIDEAITSVEARAREQDMAENIDNSGANLVSVNLDDLSGSSTDRHNKRGRQPSPTLSCTSTSSVAPKKAKDAQIGSKSVNTTGKAALTPSPGLRQTIIDLNKDFNEAELVEPKNPPQEVVAVLDKPGVKRKGLPHNHEELFTAYQVASYIGKEPGTNKFHFWYWREFSPGCPICGNRFKANQKPYDLNAHAERKHTHKDGGQEISLVFHPINKKK